MDASSEILSILARIRDGEWDRAALAKWMAERSLTFLASPFDIDRLIVTELDAALGEIQDGRRSEDFLATSVSELVRSLRLTVPDGETFVEISEPPNIVTHLMSSSTSDVLTISVHVEESIPLSA